MDWAKAESSDEEEEVQEQEVTQEEVQEEPEEPEQPQQQEEEQQAVPEQRPRAAERPERRNDNRRAERTPNPLPDSKPFQAFIGQLPQRVTELDLAGIFEKCGRISSVRVVKKENQPKAIAYIEFETRDALASALQFNGQTHFGRPLRVDVADHKPTRQPRGHGRDSHHNDREGKEKAGAKFRNGQYFGSSSTTPAEDNSTPNAPLERKKLHLAARSNRSEADGVSRNTNIFGYGAPRAEKAAQEEPATEEPTLQKDASPPAPAEQPKTVPPPPVNAWKTTSLLDGLKQKGQTEPQPEQPVAPEQPTEVAPEAEKEVKDRKHQSNKGGRGKVDRKEGGRGGRGEGRQRGGRGDSRGRGEGRDNKPRGDNKGREARDNKGTNKRGKDNKPHYEVKNSQPAAPETSKPAPKPVQQKKPAAAKPAPKPAAPPAPKTNKNAFSALYDDSDDE